MRFDTSILPSLRDRGDIERYLADIVKTIPDYNPDDDHRPMHARQNHALLFVQAAYENYQDDNFLDFVTRYDLLYGKRLYVYYSGPTTTPDEVITTLSQIVIDSLMFEADWDDYADTLRYMIENGFAQVTA